MVSSVASTLNLRPLPARRDVLVAVVAVPYSRGDWFPMTTPPTTASAPVPRPRVKTCASEAKRRRKTKPQAAGAVHLPDLRPPTSAIGNEGTAVPESEYGVMIAVPGHRPQVVLAHPAEQVLAHPVQAARQRLSRPG